LHLEDRGSDRRTGAGTFGKRRFEPSAVGGANVEMAFRAAELAFPAVAAWVRRTGVGPINADGWCSSGRTGIGQGGRRGFERRKTHFPQLREIRERNPEQALGFCVRSRFRSAGDVQPSSWEPWAGSQTLPRRCSSGKARRAPRDHRRADASMKYSGAAWRPLEDSRSSGLRPVGRGSCSARTPSLKPDGWHMRRDLRTLRSPTGEWFQSGR
jgi:hypothetical protein